MKSIQDDVHLFLLGAVIALVACVAGCQQKETLLDVETSRGGVEIQRDKQSGDISIDVDES